MHKKQVVYIRTKQKPPLEIFPRINMSIVYFINIPEITR
jgi:hypothetical protein